MRGVMSAGMLVIFVLSVTPLSRAETFDHAYFQSIKGQWVGEGELTNAEGEATAIHEEWTAVPEDDSFAIRGTRQWGDDSQEFRWIFRFNASTELYECEYWHTGMDAEMIFEVSLSDGKAELRTPFGEPGGELLVANTVTEQGIDGLVKFSNSAGEVLLEGVVKHTKAVK